MLVDAQSLHLLLDELRPLPGGDQLRNAMTAAARSPWHVVVGGDFNSGKSMLLNALLGRRLLISSAIPTTSHVTEIHFGFPELVRVRRRDNRVISHSLDELEGLTTLDIDGVGPQDVEQITICCRSRITNSDLIFVDTPGTNDDPKQTRRAREALALADVVIWVLRGDAVLKQGERQFTTDWLADNPNVILVPVVNFMNFVARDQQVAVRQRVRSVLDRDHGPRVKWLTKLLGQPFFEIDAQRALDWTADQTGTAEPHFLRLEGWLNGLVQEDLSRHAKSRIRGGWIDVRIAAVRKANQERLNEVRRRLAEAAHLEEMQRLQHQATLRRFESRSTFHLDLVEREAGKPLAERRENLLTFWLSNESASSLRRNTDRWGATRLQEAAATISAAANTTAKALAAEFSLTVISTTLEGDLSKVEFDASFPTTGFLDDMADLVGAPPTKDYMAKFRAAVRTEWEKRAALLLATLRTSWSNLAQAMKKVIEDNTAKSPNDASESLKRDLEQCESAVKALDRLQQHCNQMFPR